MMEEEFVKQEVIDDLDADNNIHGQYHCKECNKVYSSKKKLDGHISFVHTIQIVVCEFCSKEFKNKTACKQHVRNVHESASSKEESCPTCGKTFKRKSLVDAHIRNVHESADNLFCHVCGSQSKNLNALKKHVKKCEEKPKRATKHFVPGNRVGDPELGNNTYYDEFCDRTYLNYNSFRIHNHNTHTDDPISCRICQTVLKSRDLIRRHYMMKHNILDKEVLKDLSGAGFGKRAQIKEGRIMEDCPTCKQTYCQKYLNRFHREQCALGKISTNPPREPGFTLKLSPEEMLARYAVSRTEERQREELRKREEKIERWRQMAKTGLGKERASASKRKKDEEGMSAEEDINETDDNSNLENYKEEPESEEDEVQFKEEVEDMDVKEEVEEKDENFEDKVESYNDQECGWHEEENSDELEDGNINPAETDDFSASTPRPQSENPPEMDFKVKDENNIIKLNQSSLCTECGKSFASVTSLVDHVKATHAAKTKNMERSIELDFEEASIGTSVDKGAPLQCEHCAQEGKSAKIYKSHSLLQTHVTNWHDFGTYLCDTCGDSFELRGQLKNHNNEKHSRRNKSTGGACPQCGKVVKYLSGHIKEVHGEKEECVCPVCARIYYSVKQMRDHVRANHNNEGKVFVCHICSKQLGNPLILKQHLQRQHYNVPTPEDYVTCQECGKQFAKENLLKAHHRNVHESDPQNCDLCGGTYKNSYSLSKHMKNAHSGHLSKVGKGSYKTPTKIAPNPQHYGEYTHV